MLFHCGIAASRIAEMRCLNSKACPGLANRVRFPKDPGAAGPAFNTDAEAGFQKSYKCIHTIRSKSPGDAHSARCRVANDQLLAISQIEFSHDCGEWQRFKLQLYALPGEFALEICRAHWVYHWWRANRSCINAGPLAGIHCNWPGLRCFRLMIAQLTVETYAALRHEDVNCSAATSHGKGSANCAHGDTICLDDKRSLRIFCHRYVQFSRKKPYAAFGFGEDDFNLASVPALGDRSILKHLALGTWNHAKALCGLSEGSAFRGSLT